MNKKIILFVSLLVCLLNSKASFAETLGDCDLIFERNLKFGDQNHGVLMLQKILNHDKETALATTGIGSAGFESNYFGVTTRLAVIKFQNKYKDDILLPNGLISGNGYVGNLTRSKLHSVCSGLQNDFKTEQKISNDSFLLIEHIEQPPKTLALSGAGGVPFVNLKIKAVGTDVDVNSFTFEFIGLADKSVLDSIVLVDQYGDQIGDEYFVSQDRKIKITEDIHIDKGEELSFTILGNMVDDLSLYDGQLPQIQLSEIDSSARISGNLPVKGTAQTINSNLSIGSATAYRSSYDPMNSTRRYINDSNVIFSGIKITANSIEDLTLNSITWAQNGTAGIGDIDNIYVYVNGHRYDTKRDGRYYGAVFDDGVLIKKGDSVDVYISGDLLPSGANRNVKFDIDESGAIGLVGNTYGYDVGVGAGGNTAVSGNSVFITSDGTEDGEEGNPFFSGSVVDINSGTIGNIGKSVN